MRTIAVVLMMLAAAPAAAQEASEGPVDVNAAALVASSVHEEHCADTRGNDTSVFGAALAATSAAFVEIDKAYAATQDPSLLYWRGLLALCINREDAGAADLTSFLEGVGDDKAYTGQIKDAQRRLRRVQLSQRSSGAPAAIPNAGGVAATLGLGIGAGTLGGLTAWSSSELEHLQSQLANGELRTEAIDQALIDGPTYETRANALIGATAGVGAGALIAGVITALTADRDGSTASWSAPSVAAVPTRGGVQIVVGGAW